MPPTKEPRSRQSSALPDASVATATSGPQPRRLGRWFWGTIFLLAGLTILLVALGWTRLQNQADVTTQAPTNPWSYLRELVQPLPPAEFSSTRLEQMLQQAREEALAAAIEQIEPLLHRAWEPAHAAVPAYLDFHYSVPGEYFELGQFAMGKAGEALQEKLFSGLEARLNEVATQLDLTFDTSFRASLQNQTEHELSGAEGLSLGPLTRQLLDNTINRVSISAPVATLAALGTTGSLSLIAKSLAAKLGTKAAAKAGSKAAVKGGTSVASGIGSGALLCSWAGPAAAGCAVAGGVIAWIGTDWLLIKADEYFNREEFEAELHTLLEEQRAEVASQLRDQLIARAGAVRQMNDEELSNFTLKDLATRRQR